jgi:Zn-dependent peptidase ImmA (M78 family)
LKARHLREMEEEEERIKAYLDSYLKPSKRVIDLRAKERISVKQRDYSEAEKMKNLASRL